MYKMKKDGVVRIVATEAEKKRWEALGYKTVEEAAGVSDGGQNAEDPLKNASVEELKAFAFKNSIDIGNSTSQNGIYKKIRDALPWDPSQAVE